MQLSTIDRGLPYASWLFRHQSQLEAFLLGRMVLWGLVDVLGV
jgi:hypothetical protein